VGTNISIWLTNIVTTGNLVLVLCPKTSVTKYTESSFFLPTSSYL